MDLAAVPDLRVEAAGDEVTYHLPARPLGLLRLVGVLPIGFSAVWFSGLIEILLQVLKPLAGRPWHGLDYFLVGFLLCFIAAGCGPAGFGLLILFGRTRIRWRDGRLTATEMLGPLGWPRRMPRAPLRRFLLVGGESGVAVARVGGVGALMAQFEAGGQRTVAADYPRPWLEAIAQDLSARAGLAQATSPRVEVFDGRPQPPNATAEKPPDSKVALQRGPASITLEVPPLGLRKGSAGLIYFATVWCVFMAFFTYAVAFGHKNGPDSGPPIFLMVPLFWAIGLTIMAVSIHLGRRRVTLMADHSELRVVKTSPFGVKRLQFRRADVQGVVTGRSNVRVNNRPLPELRILLAGGDKIGLCPGYGEDELRWMAAELNQALGLAESVPAVPAQPFTRAEALARWQQSGNPKGGLIGLAIFVAIAVVLFWNFGKAFKPRAPAKNVSSAQTLPLPVHVAAIVPAKTAEGIPGLAYTSFGPGKAHGSNAWAAGRETHAEWFVAEKSGCLNQIELAMEPTPRVKRVSKATVFLARDNGGFPGKTLESFSFRTEAPDVAGSSDPVMLASVKQPTLEAGQKYWVCAKSQGGWAWYFNAQNILHNSAREARRGTWASAGDSCYIGAFSVSITTNPPPTNAAPQVEADAGNTN